MLIMSGRAYKQKCIVMFTFVAILYALMLPLLSDLSAPLVAHITQTKLLFTAISYLMHGTIVLIACRTLFDGLTLHRPLVVADETGLHLRTRGWGISRFVRWDEIRRADVSTIHGPEVLWNRTSRWQWRTLTFYAADPASLAQGGRSKIARYVSGGAVACIPEAMAGPQFGELIAFANAHIPKPA